MLSRLLGLVTLAAISMAARDPAPGPGGRTLQELSEKGIRFYAEFTQVDDRPLKVLVRSDGGEDRLYVFDSARGIQLIEDSGQTDRFVDAQVFQSDRKSSPVIVTRWSKGAHGQQVRIYDGSTMVFQKASAWPMEIEEQKGRLRIRGGSELEKDGQKPKPFEVRWPR